MMFKTKIKLIFYSIRKYTFCKIGLHLIGTVHEKRPRYKGNHIRGSFSYGTSKFTHYVQGYYDQCICCGKKFSNFKRIKNYG